MTDIAQSSSESAASHPPTSAKFAIDDLVLDTGKRELQRNGELIGLPKLSYRLFAALVSAAPDVLTHEELLDQIWGGRVTSAETLTQRIKLLRRALGDAAASPRYIGLVRGQGYRLLPEVEPLQTARDNRDQNDRAASPATRMASWIPAFYWVAAALLAAIGLIWMVDTANLGDRAPPIPIRPAEQTIAVLPFKNRSAADGDALFVDGMHDDILTSLAKIDSLRVVSRTSVEQFRNTDKTIPQIAQELGVATILEGGVQRSGDRIRVNVQLIDAQTDTHLWVDSFDEELTVANVFTIQSEISSAIAESMQSVLTPEARSRLANAPTENLEAYEAYLRGVRLLRRRTGATIKAAIAQFEESIRHDPRFALPYVGLADSYQLLPSYASESAEALLPAALDAANAAIRLDPENGAAFASLAMIYFEANRIRTGAIAADDPEPLFRHALKLSPNYATGLQWYGEYLAAAGRLEEAVAQFERASTIDPLSPVISHVYAYTLANLGRYEEAETRFRKAVEIDPGFARAYQGLASLYFSRLGRLADAALAARQATLLNPAEATNFALLSNIYIHLGDDAEAEYWLAEANRLQPAGFYSQRVTTLLHLYRNELEAAAQEAGRGLARYPRDSLFLKFLRDYYLSKGKIDAAARLYEDSFPEFFAGDVPQVGGQSFWFAIDCARVLQKAERPFEAQKLLDQAQTVLNARAGHSSYRYEISRAAIHALNDETDLALASLQRAIDMGWRKDTFYLFGLDPNFDSIRNEPDFQAMAADLRADSAAQLKELRAMIGPGF